MVCESEALQRKKVCVVGAGMAGLAAARELRREGHAVTVMEQSGDVGGQWLYDPRTDDDDPLGVATPPRVPSSIYASLRLLSPREIAGFSGFPFAPVPGRDPRRFPCHREMYLYFKDFCHAFGLMDAIRINTKVVRVAAMAPRPQAVGAGEPKWVVRTTDLVGHEAPESEEEVFDAVVVATGQYSQPSLPRIQGMEEWRHRQLHSHSYRVPEPFRGEVVVVVGCGFSGKDIALDIRRVAKEVHLAVKSTHDAMSSPAMCKLLAKHDNLHLHPQIERLCEDSRVVFADGESVVADTVVYCTGYTYSFPFLDTGGLVTVEDSRVGPLFEHTFPPALAPSLSFVGVPRNVVVPWFFEAQARWIAQVLSGRRRLPPEEEMMRSVEEHYRSMEAAGEPVKNTHNIGGIREPQKMFELLEGYCDESRIEDWKIEMLRSTGRDINDDLETFRDRVNDDDTDNIRECLERCNFLSDAHAHKREAAATLN